MTIILNDDHYYHSAVYHCSGDSNFLAVIYRPVTADASLWMARGRVRLYLDDNIHDSEDVI